MNDYSLEGFNAYVRLTRAPNTASKYTDAARDFLAFCDTKKYNLAALPSNALNEYVSFLLARNLAPRSVHVYVAGARKYLLWCEGHGLSTPVRMQADMPKAAAPMPNALRDETLLAYLRAASLLHEPYRTALLLLPYCGLRSEELAQLTHGSIRKVALPIRGTNEHREYIVFLVRGKGGKTRMAPLLLDGVPLFIKYMKEWRQHQAGGDPWIFPGQGTHIATRTMRWHCQQIRKTVPTPNKLTPHVLRDTYITTLWRCGVDLASIAKAVGHASIETTQRHYLDIQDEELVNAVVKRDARLVLESPGHARGVEAVDFLRRTSADRDPTLQKT